MSSVVSKFMASVSLVVSCPRVRIPVGRLHLYLAIKMCVHLEVVLSPKFLYSSQND